MGDNWTVNFVWWEMNSDKKEGWDHWRITAWWRKQLHLTLPCHHWVRWRKLSDIKYFSLVVKNFGALFVCLSNCFRFSQSIASYSAVDFLWFSCSLSRSITHLQMSVNSQTDVDVHISLHQMLPNTSTFTLSNLEFSSSLDVCFFTLPVLLLD